MLHVSLTAAAPGALHRIEIYISDITIFYIPLFNIKYMSISYYSIIYDIILLFLVIYHIHSLQITAAPRVKPQRAQPRSDLRPIGLLLRLLHGPGPTQANLESRSYTLQIHIMLITDIEYLQYCI